MALLPDATRFEIWGEFMRRISRRIERVGTTMNKADIRAVVDALDAWQDANAAAVNQAIPEPGRSQLTQSQKAEIFAMVSLARYGG